MSAAWWSEREDGRPGGLPVIAELHGGTPAEVIRWACPVRLPWQRQPRRVRLVIRAYTATANVTVALEAQE